MNKKWFYHKINQITDFFFFKTIIPTIDNGIEDTALIIDISSVIFKSLFSVLSPFVLLNLNNYYLKPLFSLYTLHYLLFLFPEPFLLFYYILLLYYPFLFHIVSQMDLFLVIICILKSFNKYWNKSE